MKTQIKKLFLKIFTDHGYIEIFKAIAIAFYFFPAAQMNDVVDTYNDIFEDYEAYIQEAVELRR